MTAPFSRSPEILPPPSDMVEVPALGQRMTPGQQEENRREVGAALTTLEDLARTTSHIEENTATLDEDDELAGYFAFEVDNRGTRPTPTDTYLEATRQNHAAQHHESRVETNRARASLVEALRKSDTQALLVRMELAITGTVADRDRARAAAADARAEAEAAGTRARTAFSDWLEVRQRQARDGTTQKLPEGDLPSVPSGVMPWSVINRHSILKDHTDYDTRHRNQETIIRAERNQVSGPATAYARAFFDEYRHLYTGRKPDHVTVRAAERDARLSDAVAREFSAAFTEVNDARNEVLDRSSEFRGRIDRLLAHWQYGEVAPDPRMETAIAKHLEGWRRTLEGMSVYDGARPRIVADWITAAARFHERRAILLPDDESLQPSLDFNRGVRIQTPEGEQILYGDGSIAREEDGEFVRRWANGNVWEQPLSPLPSVDERELANLSTRDLEDARSVAFTEWETLRTPQAEVDAAVTSREHARRLETMSTAANVQSQTAQDAYTAAEAAYTELEGNRAAAIDLHVENARANDPDLDEGLARHAATTAINDQIERLRTARDHARTAAETARDNALTAREAANRSHYFRYYFGVTRPERAGLEPDSTAHTYIRGQIRLQNGTFNGIRGNWVINSDGSSMLLGDGPDETDEYAPNGTLIPKPTTP